MKPFPVTVQMIIKNEERFTWFAIKAVLPYVKKFLITDTGSTDNTLKIIKSIKSKKIALSKDKKENIVKIRQKQLKQTKTPWFFLVDGDEVWPKDQLLKLLQSTKAPSKGKIAVVNRTRNCIGDVWHYLPEKAGKYQLLGKKGHFNIRLMRTLPYKIEGIYPWEEYRLNGKSINIMNKRLAFSDSWYLHTTHLKRSSNEPPPATVSFRSFKRRRKAGGFFVFLRRNPAPPRNMRGWCWGKIKVKGRRKQVIEKGILMQREELPEIFFQNYPKIITDPLIRRNKAYEIKATLLTPLKKIKRLLVS